LFSYSTKTSGAFATVVQGHSAVKRFHVHQTRHTFATRWLEGRGSLAVLQQILGHSTIVVTQRYARLGDDLVEAEANRVYGSQTVASDKTAAS
jgi:integrase